jgi:hypothetical protein
MWLTIMYWHFSKHKSILSNTSLFLRQIFMFKKNSRNFLEDMCHFYICSCEPRNLDGIECHFYKSITWRFSCRQANKQTSTKKKRAGLQAVQPSGEPVRYRVAHFKLVSRTRWSRRTLNGVQASRCNTLSATQLPLNGKENSYSTII